MTHDLIYEIKEDVAWITINRESKRNAISREMIEALLTHLEEIDQEDEVRAVCITGAGHKVFCAGADLGAGQGSGDKGSLTGPRTFARLLKRMTDYDKPMIARVNGACLAGGLGLMLACDIAIASEDATFCTPEINVGIWPMMIGALMYRDIGRRQAMGMVLTGKRISARDALQMGLITQMVEAERLDEEVGNLLAQMTVKSPLVIRIGKKAFRRMEDMPLNDAVDYLCGKLGEVMSTEDAAEGIKAFREKRQPKFKGR
ncbi:MAG: enoyl-CoA hydratase/isomerase family protein [Desulfobacteraceae bacterium]